jgi:hypothetical protein
MLNVWCAGRIYTTLKAKADPIGLYALVGGIIA